MLGIKHATAVATAALLALAGVLHAQGVPTRPILSDNQPPVRGSGVSSQDRAVSATVMASIVDRDSREIMLMVLWRGAPGWFTRGPAVGSDASGGGTGVRMTTLHYGGRDLTYTFDPRRRLVTIQGANVPLDNGKNVILVDRADTDKVAVVGVVAIEGKVEEKATIASLFRRSDEVMKFLQCEIVWTEKPLSHMLNEWVCNQPK